MLGNSWKPREEAQLHTPYLLALALAAAAVIFASVDWAFFAALSAFWAGGTAAVAYGYNNGYADAQASPTVYPVVQPSTPWPSAPSGIPSTFLSDDHDHAPGFSRPDWEAQEAELVDEFKTPVVRSAVTGRDVQDATGEPDHGYGGARTVLG